MDEKLRIIKKAKIKAQLLKEFNEAIKRVTSAC